MLKHYSKRNREFFREICNAYKFYGTKHILVL